VLIKLWVKIYTWMVIIVIWMVISILSLNRLYFCRINCAAVVAVLRMFM
jgi:hypothetical protein